MTAAERDAELARTPMEVVGSQHGFVTGTAHSVRQIWGYRHLLFLLTRREIKVRYKDSAFGLVWSLIRPLAMLIVYYVAIGKFLGAERAIPDFAIYIFTGLTGWQLFNEIVASSTSSILGNAGLIKKIYLPREVFPLSAVGSALFNFVVQLSILTVATFAIGKPPTLEGLTFLPLAIAVLIVYGTAIGLLTAAANVYLRDVQYLVEITLMVLFWTTPTVYSWELVRDAVDSPVVESLYLGNPVAVSILAMQRTFWVAGAGAPAPENLGLRLVVMLAIGLLLLWISQRVFARLEGNFAQEM
ncbi:MAG TPA: ABC transporter permease [Nocardioidaceae bacterium]|nr:ABC transporter permease [Nocardioidaceae bacterium]